MKVTKDGNIKLPLFIWLCSDFSSNKNLHSNKFLSGSDKGPVIIYRLGGGAEDFRGDHLIFERKKRGDHS